MIYLPLDRLLDRSGARGTGGANVTPAPALPELPPVTVDGRQRSTR
jgi:hypothetical protein